MIHFTVQFKSIKDVKDFVHIVNKYPYDVDLSSGRYVVDAKSIMGIFSLELQKNIKIIIHADEAADLEKELTTFCVS